MQYVTRATLAINGQDITDFKAVSEKSRTIHKQVPLMYKTGTATLTQRFSGDLDYVIPRDTPEFNFDGVVGGTLIIEYDNGEQVRFGGVATAETGDVSIDGENEAVKKVAWIAESRNGQVG